MIIILILSLMGSTSNAEVPKCCSGINTIMENGSCYDGVIIRMNVTCQYRVLLTKNDFAVTQNGSLIWMGMDVFVPQERFCLAKNDRTGENVSVVCIMEAETTEKFYVTRVICSLISVVFLLITIVIYILVPKLRDLQGKCILNSMIGLTLAFISLAVIQLENSFERGSCLFWAFAVYFTFLVAFFWLNVVAINMWRKTVISTLFDKSDNFWYILYLIYGFGAPVVFLLSTIISHNVEGDHIKPGIGDGVCFLNAPLPLWSYFYGPIAVLLTINLILFIWSSVYLWMEASEESSRVKNLKYKCLLTLKLCLIMGVPWMFEVISFSLENVHEYLDYLWTITDYLNSLQGILIFMVLVLFRKKALRGLASNPMIGSKFPKAWQRLDDAECSDEEGLAETK